MHDQSTFVNYDDDMATIDHICCETVYHDMVSDVARWCRDDFLDLREHNTEELVVDFRIYPTSPKDLVINGEIVKRVPEYMYGYT